MSLFKLFNIETARDWAGFFLPTLRVMISSYETGEIMFIPEGTLRKLNLKDNTLVYDNGQCEECIAFVNLYVISKNHEIQFEKTKLVQELYNEIFQCQLSV